MARGVDLALHVTPRAGRDVIEGVDGEGRLRLRVSAAPVDGAANDAVVALLAAELGVRRSAVTLTGGATSRYKRCHVDGVDAAPLYVRWPGLRVGDRPSG
jgi:uncharacterized protein YggU (UPF0235/DUF167 family)